MRQYSQKLLFKNSSLTTSSMRLFSISSRVARKMRTMSFWALSVSLNLKSVPASTPCSMVTRRSEKFGSSLFSQKYSSRTLASSCSIDGIERNRSHRHSKWVSISRPPRMTNPFLGSLMPSSAPPGRSSSSKMVILSPDICASRIRKAAPDREARPAPTNHAVLSSTPSGLRGRAKAS
ncbi:Uncharacterised protein [Mycobacteroides abscessus subsp. abscessus]|nr:Uncharacterised protein [Mycobacteroides abscessus subsp. abscessus]